MDNESQGVVRAGVESLLTLIDRFDTGHWSRYDLYPHPIPNVASGAYHLLHENQLSVLSQQTGEAAFERASTRFAAYGTSAMNRRRAFLAKAAFRTLVPRNETFAKRSPFFRQAARKGHEDLVVLCYHGISEDWRSELTVTPQQLESQVEQMLTRGYSAVTFSEAILAPRWRKTFAVTFDDAYASVGSSPGPSSIGSASRRPCSCHRLQESHDPMTWPGIDHWAEGMNKGDCGRSGGSSSAGCRRRDGRSDRTPGPIPA